MVLLWNDGLQRQPEKGSKPWDRAWEEKSAYRCDQGSISGPSSSTAQLIGENHTPVTIIQNGNEHSPGKAIPNKQRKILAVFI
jgi:hypothetical protein